MPCEAIRAIEDSPKQWQKSSHRRGVNLAIIAGLALAVVLCYLPVIGFGFICYDDPDYVTSNPMVKSGLTLGGIKWAFASAHAANWHPLTWISHMLDCQIFGLRAGGHHFINLALHAINTLLIFAFFRYLTGSEWRSALLAAIFGLHPMHVESVAWISERKDVLSTFFGILSLWAYCAYARRREKEAEPETKKMWFYWLAWTSFLLGLLSKPMLVTWPFLMFLLDYWPLKQMSDLEGHIEPARIGKLIITKVPFLILSAASCIVTIIVQRAGGAVASLDKLPFGERLLNAVVSYFSYISKLLWPERLAVVYPYMHRIPPGRAVTGILGMLLITGVVLWQWRRRPYLSVGWLWFLGTLVPVIGLIQVGNQPMADRYTYIPSIGLFFMLIWGVAQEIGRNRSLRITVTAVFAMAVGVCGIRGRGQVNYWQNSATLFQHALDVEPRNPIAYNNLGLYFAGIHADKKAMQAYHEALAINPGYQHAWNNVGCLLIQAGEYEAARTNCEMALHVDPSFAEAHNNLGTALLHLGRFETAIAEFGTATTLRPGYAEAHYNLATALAQSGNLEGASAHFEKALKLVPVWADAHNNLGFILAKQGKMAEAMQEFRVATEENHDSWQGFFGLSAVFESLGRHEEAQAAVERALGLAQKAGESEAVQECQQLLARIGPRSPTGGTNN